MPIKKDAFIARKQNKPGSDKVVERNPSSNEPAVVMFILFCLAISLVWFNNNDKKLDYEIVKPDVEQTEQDTSSSRLHRLIKRGRLEDIEQVLKVTDAKELNTVFNGMTPVMTASSVGDAKVVELLLDYGADPDKRGSARRTALQYAAEKNHIAVARKLLQFGADIDAYDNSRLTPLIMAADRGYTDLGILLIESGADVNIQHIQGWTALIDAARNGNIKLVQYLLSAGAKRDISTGQGRRAIDFARENGHENIVKALSD